VTDDDEASGADPVKAWQAALRAAPFHNWLDLDIVALSGDSLELAMPWRDEIVSNPRIGSVHGGVLASLIDLAGFYVLLVHSHRVTATATLSVDYHRPATAGPIFTSSSIVKVGRRWPRARCEALAVTCTPAVAACISRANSSQRTCPGRGAFSGPSRECSAWRFARRQQRPAGTAAAPSAVRGRPFSVHADTSAGGEKPSASR